MTVPTRIVEMVAAARRLADPHDSLGQKARRVLPFSTGLSAEGVRVALETSLETEPTADDLAALVASAASGARSWVLLSANVFTAAHRAIALGLASSSDVRVRPSRRSPDFVALLKEAGGPFTIVDELDPEPGDVVYAYGRDETLSQVSSELATGVRFVGHGAGIGVAVLAGARSEMADAARRLSLDVVLFDQRGCLSPRVVLCVGERAAARDFSEALAQQLRARERDVPIGRIDDAEAALAARYRETMRYAGRLVEAGTGSVGCVTTPDARVVVPPPGRHVYVMCVPEPTHVLAGMAGHVTAIGVDDIQLARLAGAAVPHARLSAIGAMQRPPLDGPVDRRARRVDLVD